MDNFTTSWNSFARGNQLSQWTTSLWWSSTYEPQGNANPFPGRLCRQRQPQLGDDYFPFTVESSVGLGTVDFNRSQFEGGHPGSLYSEGITKGSTFHLLIVLILPVAKLPPSTDFTTKSLKNMGTRIVGDTAVKCLIICLFLRCTDITFNMTNKYQIVDGRTFCVHGGLSPRNWKNFNVFRAQTIFQKPKMWIVFEPSRGMWRFREKDLSVI